MIITLNGSWDLAYDGKTYRSLVPGTLLKTLINQGIISNPYFGLNEAKTLDYLKKDCVYSRKFNLKESDIESDIYLVIEGIDTAADLYINEKLLSSIDDMHRSYEFKLKPPFIKLGVNRLKIVIHSAFSYLDKNFNPNELFSGFQEANYRFPKMRKAHCSFGWDWGPTLPDMGIFRPIYLYISKVGKIDDLREFVTFKNNGSADLNVLVKGIGASSTDLLITLLDPLNNVIENNKMAWTGDNQILINIKNPQRWNPSGFGDTPLYTLRVELINSLDSFKKEIKIGLNELKIIDAPDQYGKPLTINMNGRNIFLKGSDFIPVDAIYPDATYEKTRQILKMARDSNQNTIRVWGGGYFPEDWFFDITDEFGLMVILDLMFACATYDSSDKHFMENIEEEARCNLRRLRHHPSLIMISGNNECEEAITSWNPKRVEEQKNSYREIFLGLLPRVVTEESNLYYLSSSPTSGEPIFINPQDDRFFDRHSWEVWHGNQPIEYYRTIYPRLLSEFGLQSYPSRITIRSYAKDDELREDSEVMLAHQKNKVGNEKIHYYLSLRYNEPKNFSSLVFLSQLSQAEAVRMAVEHLRINKGRCMGALYWQLNDCWGVQSWSSIDYCLVPKILHYYARKFYRDIILSFEPKEDKIALYLSSDRVKETIGKVEISLITIDGKILSKKYYEVHSSYDKAVLIDLLTSYNNDSNKYYKASFMEEMKPSYVTYYFFNAPKNIPLKDPRLLLLQVSPKALSIKANELAYGVTLESDDPELTFSDNGFIMEKDEERKILLSKETEKENIRITSLFEATSHE